MADIQNARSRPFMITLPSGTKLYGFTETMYTQENGVVKPDPDPTFGSRLLYWTEVSRSDWKGPNEDAIQYAAPGTGTPKFYNLQGIFSKGKWLPAEAGGFAGAELKQEFAKYNAGNPTQISTVVATGPQAVALATGTSASGLASVLFNSNVARGNGSGAGGSAADPPAKPDGTLPPVDPEHVTPGNLDAVISDNTRKIRDNYGTPENLRYPYDLKLETQDCIQFTMFRYAGRSLKAISKDTIANAHISGPGASSRRLNAMGTVTLPIQPSITDSNGVEWGGANLSPIEAYAASLSRGAMDEPGAVVAGSNIIGKVMENLKGIGGDKDFQNAIKLYLAQEAVGIQGLLSRTTGAIVNPNLELLFNGPTLRPFSFTFRLSPRSASEAANVKRIIRFFKQGMSVKTSNTTVFLKAPNIFGIRYLSGPTNDHPSLNRIKDCALLGCDVDYTPDGTYMTFDDEGKTMTSYQLTLRFSELEPVYEDDYFTQGLGPDDIGY